jgi:hypothetical protein
MIFCTLFNASYLPQGIALYHSLERTMEEDFILYVLCMDDLTSEVLAKLNFPSLKRIALEDVEDNKLRAVRDGRTIGEYCWTCTGPLLLHLFDRHPSGTVVTYVDADIRFFSDPTAILEELGSGSIFIHEHDFAPRFSGLLAISGRFNVGVASFRHDAEGSECLRRWTAQCLDQCVMDLSAGQCGDQNYLDEWPSLYSNLVVSSNPGIGLGPWNIEKHSVGSKGGRVVVDCRPAVFYHYHSLQLLRPRLGIKPILMSRWFSFEKDVVRALYHPYARDLWHAVDEIEQNGLSVAPALDRVPDRYSEISGEQLLLSFGKIFVPRPWNSWIFSKVSGAASSWLEGGLVDTANAVRPRQP